MLTELAVPVVNQIHAVILQQNTVFDIDDVPYYLRHPLLMRILRDPRDVNLACTKMNEEKDIVCIVTRHHTNIQSGCSIPSLTSVRNRAA